MKLAVELITGLAPTSPANCFSVSAACGLVFTLGPLVSGISALASKQQLAPVATSAALPIVSTSANLCFSQRFFY